MSFHDVCGDWVEATVVSVSTPHRPESWHCTVYSRDAGRISVGFYDTKSEANAAAREWLRAEIGRRIAGWSKALSEVGR